MDCMARWLAFYTHSVPCVYLSHWVIIELQQIRSEYCMLLTVLTLNMNYDRKSKALLYHVDISGRYFIICQSLKSCFSFCLN